MLYSVLYILSTLGLPPLEERPHRLLNLQMPETQENLTRTFQQLVGQHRAP
jgi:hypothetical protein